MRIQLQESHRTGRLNHARREFFLPKLLTFPRSQVYLNAIHAKQMISLLLLNNLYTAISYRRRSKEEESDELLYTVLVARYGPQSVGSARG